MKKKKVIGIDLNEVVRAHWYAVEEFYLKEMKEIGEAGVVSKPFNTYEYLNHFAFPDKEIEVRYLKKDIPEDIAAADYKVDKKGKSKADPLLFDIVKEHRTSQQRLDEFLYDDYVWELFGNCGKIYHTVVNDLHELFDKYKNNFDFVIVSLEQHRSIMATLHFLGKSGVQLPQYLFAGRPETIWNKVDILITANPKMITTKPFNKNVIVVSREFNKELIFPNDTMVIRTLNDFHTVDELDLKKFLKGNNFITKIKHYAINLLNKNKSHEQKPETNPAV
jgi:hypothetical protein